MLVTKHNRWCCFSFMANYHDDGQRGFRIVGNMHNCKPLFKLKFRAVDHNHQPQLITSVPLSLELETGILHCPWCGVRLDLWYEKLPQEEVPT